MFEASLVNLLQAASFGVASLSILILGAYRRYRVICGFFALTCAMAIFNLLEELNITRTIHLITPVFVIGLGPMLYLVVKSLTNKLNKLEYLHLAPMILALPFTQFTQQVILVGTVWRFVYAGLALYHIYQFNLRLQDYRSDAQEVTLRWLGWLIVIMSLNNALDLVRLNVQPYLSHEINVLGQGIGTAVNLLLLMLLTTKLNREHAVICTLSEVPKSSLDVKNNKESANSYKAIFEHLDQQMNENTWYLQSRLTISDLARLCDLQVRDISRAINLNTKQSFNDYINAFRVAHVKQAMSKNPSESLLTLAINAGFNAKSSFNYSFKKQTGMTPSEFKNSLNIASES
ncbi:hypothetical protein PA25_36710 [Pseudoalteromonas sp. A25]|uniref:helix-turn-helix domain-containing protein n=1 Tax=Pseudoalteromonas sp. A25 TaxID=116092 RepID=UPI0012605909|nr:helix-turn-helix domain-containing protein [Pseudoalteromonas sp. A25]BBN83686.1 hypothetical protein PA25_36710 [Pseudoalteromonas sp. A25]